jgi:hypothetical protein
MASPDFANMTRQELSKFRHKAIKAGSRPSAENNYFTATFSAGVSNKQPTEQNPLLFSIVSASITAHRTTLLQSVTMPTA